MIQPKKSGTPRRKMPPLRKTAGMRRAVRKPAKPVISTAKGQVDFISKIFRAKKITYNPKIDFSENKIWMRKEIRPLIERAVKTRMIPDARLERAVSGAMKNYDAKAFVQAVKSHYGLTNEKARQKAGLLLNEMFRKGRELAKANMKIQRRWESMNASEKSRNQIALRNAKDAFAHILNVPFGQAEMLLMELKELK